MNKHTNENDLGRSLVESFAKPFGTITADMLEKALDSHTGEDLLREIPIIKTILAIYKGTLSIRDTLFAKKIIRFLTQLNDVTEEERRKFTEQIAPGSKREREVGENVILVIDQLDDMKKAELVGAAFHAHLKHEISLETFYRIEAAILRLFVSDLPYLKDVPTDRRAVTLPAAQAQSLEHAGLIEFYAIPGYRSATTTGPNYTMTEIGKSLLEILLERGLLGEKKD